MYDQVRKIFHAGFLLIYLISFTVPTQAVLAAASENSKSNATLPERLGVESQISFSAPESDKSSEVSSTMNPIPATSSDDLRRASEELSLLGYTLPSFPVYQNPAGLTIEPITAYNLIVDSNVLAPSSYGPSAATLGAKFCNSTGSPMTNVWAYVGDYNADNDNTPGELGDLTPGTYPVHNSTTDPNFNTTFPHLNGTITAVDFGDPARFFALEQEAGSSSDQVDASRYLGTLAPGECRTEYWLVSYPRVATVNGSRVDVTGGVKPNDDLWLSYFFWVNADSIATSYYWRPVTMRNEISAMANKIWPNGDNKVPDVYKQAIAEVLGWDTWTPNGSGTTAYPGESVVSQGIWYDLGNVGHGFDNDGNLVPDRNIWVQPIGDAGSYDPGCFRLVRTYGLVIVKLNGGTEMLIPFVDQTYFENIPDNNTGAVGLVFYEYIALDGACTAGLTPYQEVASGYDNEKFNADFGAGIPPLQSRETNMTLDKRGFVNGVENAGVTAGGTTTTGTINYTVTFSLPDVDASAGNTMTITVGNPNFGMPLTVYETIPAGTQYVSGSASSSITMANYSKASVPATVLFSTNSGATWSTADPGNITSTSPNNLVLIKWQAQEGIVSPASGPAVTGTVSFSTYVPGTYTSLPFVDNTACIKLGDAECFEEDNHITAVLGTGTILGSVFADTNVLGNAIYETSTESGIQGVAVSLYYDANGDGDYTDVSDFLVRTIDSAATTGDYSFTQLPATSGSTRYIVVVDAVDPHIPTGYGPTTPTEYTDISLAAGVTYGDGADEPSDFGFAPALSIDKRLDTTTSVVVGNLVQYTIALSNGLPGSGGPGNACVYNVWSTVEGSESSGGANNTRFYNPGQATPNPTNAFNPIGPDGLYAYGNFEASGAQKLAGTGFGIGDLGSNITNVRMRVKYYLSTSLSNDQATLYFYTGGATYASTVFSTATLNGHVGPSNIGWMEVSLGATNPATGTAWRWSDFASSQVVYMSDKINAGDQVLIYVDALGLELTTDGTCGDSSKVLNPAPLTDAFDDAYFDFVSASPPVSSSSTGLLTWNNVGPLYPGQTRFITVTMRATQQGGTTATDNTATSTGTLFSTGHPANSPVSDTATVTIGANANTRTFSGTIFDDNSAPVNGWSGAAWTRAGTETGMDAGDTGLRGIKVNLYGCFDASTGALVTGNTNSPCSTAASGNDGEWRLVNFIYTIADGTYSFGNLAQGFYYAQVDTSYIVGSQVADVNQAGVCTTCDSLSNAPATDNVNAAFIGNLGANTSVTRVNFGYNVTGAYNVGDLLFYDWDGDGIKDAEDEGLSGVTVRLLDPSGALITTTTTGTDGSYLFSGYPNGIYTVQVDTSTLPGGLVQTFDPEGDNNSLSKFTLNGADNLTRDFAYQPIGSGTIGDTVWRDMNGDGAQSGAQETGIPGVVVKLQVDLNGDSTYVTIATDATDADGKYLFENLPVGAKYNYRVVIELDSTNLSKIPDDVYGNDYYNTTCTLDTTPTPDIIYRTVPITSGSPNNLSADFGFAPPASMGDTVFWDTNGNGTQDTGEPGVPNAKVDLYTFTDSNSNSRYDPGEIDTYFRTDYTDSTGKYLFSGLTPGYYVAIVDTTTANYDPGSGIIGNPLLNPTLTSDPSADGVAQSCSIDTINALCDARDGMRLYANTNYLGADFGFKPAGSFGDRVWIDTDNNGVSNSGESGISNVQVNLRTYTDANSNHIYDAGDTLGSVVASTTTDLNGYYFFTNISDGDYVVEVNTNTADPTYPFPGGLIATYNNDPTVDNQTSVYISGGAVSQVGNCTTMPNGCDPSADVDALNLDVDFGFRYVGTYEIAGTVCLDENSIDIGNCASTEAGYYENVLVTLLRWNDTANIGVVDAGETQTLATQNTNGTGDYSFTGLPVGKYVVAVSNLPDYLNLTTTNINSKSGTLSSTMSGGYIVFANQYFEITGNYLDVDFAFTLNPPALDYGDLPEVYKTKYASEGARHTIPTTPNLYLGSGLDSETDGVPSTGADGDDLALSDDEDGVTFNNTSSWIQGVNSGAISVNVTGSGYLYGWMDLNNDGDFSDPGEKIITSSNLVTGLNHYNLDLSSVPFGSNKDILLYSRFRIFPTQPLIPGIAYFGEASSGETEDYALGWKMIVDKDTSTPSVTPGAEAQYTIAVKNTGNFPLTNVTISDNLAAMDDIADSIDNFTYASTVSVVNSNATRTVVTEPSVGDTNLTWGTWDSIDPNGSVTITFRMAVDVTTPTDTNKYYDNTVTVTSVQLGTVDDDGTVANDSNTPTNPSTDPEDDEDIRIISGGDLSATKDDGISVYLPGQTLTYTINVYNSGPNNAVDATFADTMPSLFDSWSWSCTANGTASCGATTSGTGDISVSDVDISGGASNSLTYTIIAVVSATARGDLTNTATITAPTGFVDPTPGNNTANDTDTQVSITPVKSIQATSESATSGSDTLIGEIVRYRLAFVLPEGTNTDLQIVDDLVSGLRFLNDDSAKVALVCTASANCASNTLSGVSVDGNTVTIPTVVLPDAAISDNATTNSDNYPSSGAVYFKLGDVTNNDNDADSEYVVIEFNALVDNTAANDPNGNPGGTQNHFNKFDIVIDGTTVATSNSVAVTMTEPSIDTPFTKSVTTVPSDGGDSITYTLEFTNSGTAPAFDIVITDTLNTVLEGTVTVGGSATCGGSSITPALSSFTSQIVTAKLTCLDPSETATVVISAKVIGAAAAGTSFDNSANLTYTSLPGANGTTTNPTGSSTPGTPGDFSGERTGSGTGSNDYTASSGTVTTTLGTPTIDKLNPNPLSYVIGADVTYNICVTLPEGTIQDLVVIDDLPVGLAYQSHMVTNVANGTCAAATAVYVGDAYTGTITRTSPAAVPGTSGENLVLTFPTTTTTAADNNSGNNTFLITVTARVLNIPDNQDGTALSNSASLTYKDPNDASTKTVTDATAPTDIQVIEPLLTLDKTAAPASVSSGATVTFTLVIAHDTTNSHAAAYDLVITDTIPSGFNNLNNIIVTNPGTCATGVITSASTSSALNATIGTLPQGCTVTIEFDATADGTQTGSIQNTANITWTSLSGALSGRERDGSDGAGNLNDYVASDPASVTVTAATATISDYIWNDANGDGAQIGESGINGVRVYIDSNGNNAYDAGEPTDVTDASGNYSITGLSAGTYDVRIDTTTLPAGYAQTYDLDGTSTAHEASVTVTAGQTRTDVDFGYQQQNAVISDYVWDDANGDSAQTGESGINGVRVYIDSNGNNAYDSGEPTATTNASGIYSITGLAAGTYEVRIDTTTLPAGYAQTYDLDGIGTTHEASVTVTAGQTRTDVDFGYQQKNAVISDYVWNDANGDGAQTGESGINGVRVYIDVDGDVAFDASEPNATTAGGGLYSITGLAAGTYDVRIDTTTLPAGYTQTYDLDGTGTAHEASVTVTAGQTRTDVDFGYRQQNASLVIEKSTNGQDADTGTGPTIEIGGKVTWTYVVTNTGNVTLTNVTVTDDQIANDAADIDCGSGDNTIVSLDPGNANAVTCTATGTATVGQYSNVGTASTTFGGNPVTDTDPSHYYGMSGTISGQVRDDLDKDGTTGGISDADDSGLIGATVTLYTDPNGDGDPSDGTQVGLAVTTPGTGNFSFTNLVAGNYVVVEGDPANYISVTDKDGDMTAPAYNRISINLCAGCNSTDNDFLDVAAAPQIFVDKSLRTVTFDSPQLLRMTYDIEVRNTGNTTLNNVQVTDDLAAAYAAAVSFKVESVLPGPFTVNPVYDGNTDGGTNPTHINLLAGTDTLNPGGSGTITLVVLVDTGGKAQTYRNTAVATGDPPTGTPVNDDDFADGPAFVDPAVTKAVSPDQAAVGDQVTFTITVFNNGTQSAADVIVTDTFPDSLDLVPGSVTVTPPVNASNPPDYITVTAPRTLEVHLGTLDAVDIYVITVQAVVNSLGQPPIQNTVALSTTSPTPWNGNLITNDRAVAALNMTSDPGLRSLPRTGFAPNKVTVLPQQPAELAYSELGDVWLEIPSLGVKTSIMGVPRSAGAWDVDWLWEQAGWLQGTAFPTWQGNSVVTGHVYLPSGKPGPFVGLNKLRWGNRIIVHVFGEQYIYEVQTNQVVFPNDISILKHEDHSWLTLITCRSYNAVEDAYRYRVAVRAILTKVEKER